MGNENYFCTSICIDHSKKTEITKKAYGMKHSLANWRKMCMCVSVCVAPKL